MSSFSAIRDWQQSTDYHPTTSPVTCRSRRARGGLGTRALVQVEQDDRTYRGDDDVICQLRPVFCRRPLAFRTYTKDDNWIMTDVWTARDSDGWRNGIRTCLDEIYIPVGHRGISIGSAIVLLLLLVVVVVVVVVLFLLLSIAVCGSTKRMPFNLLNYFWHWLYSYIATSNTNSTPSKFSSDFSGTADRTGVKQKQKAPECVSFSSAGSISLPVWHRRINALAL